MSKKVLVISTSLRKNSNSEKLAEAFASGAELSLIHILKANNAKAYLVNTGWNGTGKRISIKDTRGIICLLYTSRCV